MEAFNPSTRVSINITATATSYSTVLCQLTRVVTLIELTKPRQPYSLNISLLTLTAGDCGYKKKWGIFQGHGRLMFLCLFITYVKFFWHTLVTDKTSTWQMKITGVGSLMFLIAASLLSERLLVFFSAQRYASISTS